MTTNTFTHRHACHALLAATLVLLASCGGGGSSGAASTRTPTKIGTSQQGGQVSYTGVQSARAASVVATDAVAVALGGTTYAPAGLTLQRSPAGSGNPVYDKVQGTLGHLLAVRRSSMNRATTALGKTARSAAATMATGTVYCDASLTGYYDYSYSEGLTSIEVTETYHDCNFGTGEILNGTVYFSLRLASLTSIGFVFRLGNGDGALEPTDFTVATYSGTTLLGTSTASLTYSVDLDMPSATVTNYALQVNGAIENRFTPDSLNGADANKTYLAGFNHYAADVSFDSAVSTWSQTTNGALLLSKTDNGVSPATVESANIAYSKLQLGVQTNAGGNGVFTITGTITSDFTPDACHEGMFTFETVVPVEVSASTGQPLAGHLVINDQTHVIFNADGTVSVSLDGGATYATMTLAELENICSVAVL